MVNYYNKIFHIPGYSRIYHQWKYLLFMNFFYAWDELNWTEIEISFLNKFIKNLFPTVIKNINQILVVVKITKYNDTNFM